MTTRVQLQETGGWRLARQVVLQGAILCAVCAPLPIALAGLSGLGHRWVDILAQFVAPALVASLLLTGGLFANRQARWSAASLGVSALLLVGVWPQWAPSSGAPKLGAPVIRLYSANLFYKNADVPAIRTSIEAADPDIVVLIELGSEATARVDEILAGYPHRVASLRLDQTRGPSRSVIASRYPLSALGDPPDGLHSVGALADTPLGRLNILGAHLTRPWPYQYQWGQINQTTALAEIRRSLTGPVIVAGDFNSVSSARIGKQVQAEMGLSPASGIGGTWPSVLTPVFSITIDQVYRSQDLAFTSRQLGRPNGSDHRPVVTDITLAAG
jgi:endonuclease/exonuclease/phosphatase (EEP) superfamily protein YafD